MIPKIFHYIWVGDKPMPVESVRLIESNSRINPNFDYKIWTEGNISLDAPFLRMAYEKKMWAFVSDYLRFQILYEHGGIYLDSDMELLKPLEPLLDSGGFSGLNKEHNSIYCGIIGAQPRQPLMREIIREYDHLRPNNFPTSPAIFTNVFQRTLPSDFRIYPGVFFYPVNENETASPKLLAAAYATHHWAESWRNFVWLRRILRRIKVMSIYHNLKKPMPDLGHLIRSLG